MYPILLPAILPRLLIFFLSNASPPPQCRCFPGDPCWPSAPEWDAFNKTLNGKLIATIPVGSVCHGTTYNTQKCAQLRANWKLPETHYTTSSSVMAPFFANQSCDPFTEPSTQCVIGTYVQYTVNATEIRDYQKTIAFAKRKNLRLVIRNTGHDYLGKSTGAGALAIWTHNIKSAVVLQYKSSVYNGPGMRFGAGVLSSEAAVAGHAKGLITVGGNCPTMGIAGGYTQGGGIGGLISQYGLGAEQVLEWQTVTASGQLVTATPTKNADLYWTLNGGGGGTYAAVWSVTVKAYVDQPTSGANLTFSNQGVSQETFYGAIKTFIETHTALSDAGGVSIWTVTNTSFVLAPATGPSISKDKLDEILRPTLAELQRHNMSYSYFSSQFPTYFDCYQSMNPPSETGYFQIGGRLIPKALVLAQPDELTTAIRNITAYGAGVSGLSFNLSRNSPLLPSSVNAAWREAAISVTVGTGNLAMLNRLLIPNLERLTPDGGAAYLNEANFNEARWQQVFNGESYNKSLSIKRKYDPEGLFYGRTAVGSEAWKERDDGRLCRVLSFSIHT
ncbi:FAD-binding domain-containing protein [Delitschia confertaspora ATCC 74209]|uniref:FAD-binding domain-containing protein n=1 Tax=Delitschia confertaspora ATCC 74209 TaxID=1513339 RepID=A0A9P4JIZ7_9PLEO|nr:FAD-binding domain-containing protein [Delitschia confertaspora ATCC 74209]